ncbi:MAG: transcription-repair coupling factor, partial [Spirochaetes bacterium]
VRESLKGHAFSKDTEWQYEFESGFRYEETPDQIRTIQEVKRDMESEKPMDRLICGDVGFGKTEVAIRAAFKAVMDGKQVAVLVPTTILAEQHLNTFNERFSLYPVNIEMLSRFRTLKEQKQIIENLKNGLIDIVIGTHRLIQKDIQFKDLGLVIIDEEQRFGVEHKERFKQLRKLVDVITMTATPIPRTLYMSMTQIRDMSIIETPPQDRVPIETYVVEHNDDIIVQAIRREIERGGQVYYVHNRIRTIDEKAEHLRRLMPEVSFEVAHGRMDEDELEQVMKSFFDMEFQVLVSTTIIESGLDIPNVNTIIIERADRFGLAQLYQLRGRVGRSSRKAYAYLLYPPGRIIGEKAEKRLSVINDYTELGSGFAIAMKDLEIRGAGNILGREQHGDILAVGFEMYVKLLDEAIRKLKEGEAYQEEIEPVLDLKYRGFIPREFIQSEKLRIEIYKRLASVRNCSELNALIEEVIDRFGRIPESFENLIDVVKIRILCKEVGIRYLREKENEIQVTFEKSRINILNLIKKINEDRSIFSISPKDYNTLYIYKSIPDNRAKFEFLKELFDYEEDI